MHYEKMSPLFACCRMAETKKALKRIRERITANETEDALKEINVCGIAIVVESRPAI